ncbi:MAG: magnesium transporter CorA family protein [Saprospiraceae bacterium]|nr:magnesium transporter CorA family protein [Candidatus Brachybacter algidus]MBL0118315.1 magnesium transporter CorA family protein [Candidatus Brachybacter algidus]
MIRYYTKQHGELIELTDYAVHCWINIEPPFSHEELEDLSSKFNIPLDFFTDPLDIDERSRYEKDGPIRLIVMNSPILNETDKENESIYVTVPIGIIFSPETVITICSHENPVLELFLENKIKHFDPANMQHFILQILEQNVYRFISCLKKLNLKRNLLEQELYDSSRNSELWQMLRIEKSLVYFVNSLKANELLKVKMKRIDFLGLGLNEELEEIYEDLIIDNSQALEMSNVYTVITGSTMEAFASIISNNMNVDIQRLTFVTIMLMVPTIITGFFGMNIPLPFSHNEYGAVFILIFSFIVGFGLILFLNKKKHR